MVAAILGDFEFTRLLHTSTSALEQNNEGSNALILAVANNRIDCIHELAQGQSAQTQDHQGWSALHHACRIGSYESVKILLPVSDPNLTSLSGWTPLMIAASKGFEGIVSFLAGYSNLDLRSREDYGTGLNAEEIAIEAGHRRCAEKIFELRLADTERALLRESTPDGHGGAPSKHTLL